MDFGAIPMDLDEHELEVFDLVGSGFHELLPDCLPLVADGQATVVPPVIAHDVARAATAAGGNDDVQPHRSQDTPAPLGDDCSPAIDGTPDAEGKERPPFKAGRHTRSLGPDDKEGGQPTASPKRPKVQEPFDDDVTERRTDGKTQRRVKDAHEADTGKLPDGGANHDAPVSLLAQVVCLVHQETGVLIATVLRVNWIAGEDMGEGFVKSTIPASVIKSHFSDRTDREKKKASEQKALTTKAPEKKAPMTKAPKKKSFRPEDPLAIAIEVYFTENGKAKNDPNDTASFDDAKPILFYKAKSSRADSIISLKKDVKVEVLSRANYNVRQQQHATIVALETLAARVRQPNAQKQLLRAYLGTVSKAKGDNYREWLSSLKSLVDKSWFLGYLTEDQAEKAATVLRETRRRGAFFIRLSLAEPGSLTLVKLGDREKRLAKLQLKELPPWNKGLSHDESLMVFPY